MKLSVCTFTSDPTKNEYPFYEQLLSILPVADEIVVINGSKNKNEVYSIIASAYGYFKEKYPNKTVPELLTYRNPWEPRMRRNMMVLQKSIAISHATKDWVLALDGDELLHEDDYDKIRQLMEMDNIAYSPRVRHYYMDYEHYKNGDNPADAGECWYKRRPSFFRNNLGIFDGYRYIPEEGACRYTSDLTTWNYSPLYKIAKPISVTIHHYGHLKSEKGMISKKNGIEKRHHPDWKDIDNWEWDTGGLIKCNINEHPKPIRDMLKNKKTEVV